MNHPGNKKFRQLIKEYTKGNDRRIGESIVEAIKRRGGRFLKRRKGDKANLYWYVLSREEAIEKSAQAIRDFRGVKAAAKTLINLEHHIVKRLDFATPNEVVSDNRLSLLRDMKLENIHEIFRTPERL